MCEAASTALVVGRWRPGGGPVAMQALGAGGTTAADTTNQVPVGALVQGLWRGQAFEALLDTDVTVAESDRLARLRLIALVVAAAGLGDLGTLSRRALAPTMQACRSITGTVNTLRAWSAAVRSWSGGHSRS